MPLYDYDCAACGRRFEVIHGLYESGPTTCPLCGKGPVRKAVTASAVHYKGSGWAKTERRSTSRKSAEKAEKGESTEATPTATSTPTESSSETVKDSGAKAAKDSGTTAAKPTTSD
jgi:putative FmdB family regulatory protein